MESLLLLSGIILSGVLHYTTQRIFIVLKKFDDFNFRSSHNTLATRTGGIGIFATLFIISFYYYLQGVEIFDYSLFIPLGIMFIVGVYDDFYKADFKLKFFLQIIVAKILIDQGYVISDYHGLFGLHEVPWLLAQLSTIFVFLVVVNAINFIDGIDGLAITEIIKAILLIEFFSNSFTPLSNLGFLVICCLIPLYYFNFKKRGKVFLGDGGSMFLGTLVMVYLLHVLGDNYEIINGFQINKALFCVLVLIYPLIDLLRVFVLRLKERKSPFIADQNHLHHILHKKGYRPILNVLVIQGLSVTIFLLCFLGITKL
ncbi:undecaprenyl/decaprenyl-phosphate alpha-N-acetylglucosaminyl 1-phosphate transferase [Flavobacteriaceae bacterium]|nr:undecaprenyl/decaprenyl-phosphate alpha-N-acetylglucosaminyl 1-phosphate transferase [Flavobacteriaceae bacterium]